jgi:hypothetical protein
VVIKAVDAKKESSPTRSDKNIQRLRNEPERIESVATQLSSMHTAQRAPALLALQQTHGNRYVQRVVAGIQAKLKVGQQEGYL